MDNGNNASVLNDTGFHVDIIGGAFDGDFEEPGGVTLHWTQQARSGVPIECTFERLSESNGSWAYFAQCDVAADVEVCITCHATSIANMSVSSTACIVIDLTAHAWVGPPPAIEWIETSGLVKASWSFQPPSRGRLAPIIEWWMCTPMDCANATRMIRGRTESLLVPLHRHIPEEYTGPLWLAMVAINGAGLRSGEVHSNVILVGSEDPTDGQLILGPRFVNDLAQVTLQVGGFRAPLHGISYFELCLQADATTQTGSDLQGQARARGDPERIACQTFLELPETVVLSSAFADVVANRSWNGTRAIFVSGTACTPHNRCNTKLSNFVTVDTDSPTLGYLSDGLLMRDSTWADVQFMDCSLGSSTCLLVPLSTSDSFDGAPGNHVLAGVNNGTLQLGSHLVSASWSGVADTGSGIADVELCFVSQATLMPLACASIDSSGMVMAYIPLEHLGTYHAVMRAMDSSGNELKVQSLGTQIFLRSPPPSHVVMEDGPFVPSCDAPLSAKWSPFASAGCENHDTVYKWQLCSLDAVCTTPAVVRQSLPDEFEVSAFSIILRPGVRYHSRVTAVGCSGAVVSAVSAGLQCAPNEPEPDARVPLLRLHGKSALGPNSTEVITVSWSNVFVDQQLPGTRYEVCLLTNLQQSCGVSEAPWLAVQELTEVALQTPWIPGGEYVVDSEGSYFYPEGHVDGHGNELGGQPALMADVGVRSIVAVVKAINLVGREAQARSAELIVDRGLPTVTELSIDGFTKSESCFLSGTDAVVMHWQSSDLASGLKGHLIEVHVVRNGILEALLYAAKVSAEDWTTVVNASHARDGDQLRFSVSAIDSVSLLASAHVACLVATSSPTVSALELDTAVKMPSGVYAFRARAYALIKLTVCWNLTDPSVSGVSHFEYSREARSAHGRPNPSLVPMPIGNSRICHDDYLDPSTIEAVSFVIQVVAVSNVNHRSPAVDAAFVLDDHVPLPPDIALTVHTGAPSPWHQSSSCCLSLSWEPWTDQETFITGYTICNAQTTIGKDCLDVGNATAVVIRANATCYCPAPTQARHDWHFFEHTLAAPDTSTSSVAFSFTAENAVGLQGVQGPYVVKVIDAPKLPEIRLVMPRDPLDTLAVRVEEQNEMVNTSCAQRPQHVLSAGRRVEVRWSEEATADEVEVEEEMSLLSDYRVCVNNTRCTSVAASVPAVNTSTLEHGLHDLTVRLTTIANTSTEKHFTVQADATPPHMGSVSIGDSNSAYWSVGHEVTCHIGEATDTESGVVLYEVALIESTRPYHLKDRLASPLARHDLGCVEGNVTIVLQAELVHGHRYSCVVTALNGAYLAATASSTELVVDLSRNSIQAPSVRIVDGRTRQDVAFLGNISTHIYVDAQIMFDNLTEPAISEHRALTPLHRFEFALMRKPRTTMFGSPQGVLMMGNTQAEQLGESHSFHLSSPSSLCCERSELPAAGLQIEHDAWLLMADMEEPEPVSSIALLGDSTTVVTRGAQAHLIRASQLSIIPLDACVHGSIAAPLEVYSARNASEPDAWGSVWAIRNCGKLSVFMSYPEDDGTLPTDRLVVELPSQDLASAFDCSARTYLGLRHAFEWISCRNDLNGTAWASVYQVPFEGGVPAQVLVNTSIPNDASTGWCISCIAVRGASSVWPLEHKQPLVPTIALLRWHLTHIMR